MFKCRKICTIAKGMHDYMSNECEKQHFISFLIKLKD